MSGCLARQAQAASLASGKRRRRRAHMPSEMYGLGLMIIIVVVVVVVLLLLLIITIIMNDNGNNNIIMVIIICPFANRQLYRAQYLGVPTGFRGSPRL